MSSVPPGDGGPGSETRDRILEATVHALGRHGPRKLAMADIGERAGVSRGTVYRYFPNRDHLLEALAGYESRRFEARLAVSLADEPDPEAQVRTAIAVTFTYLLEHPALGRLLETDPGFALGYLRDQLPALGDALFELVGPALEHAAFVSSGAVGARDLSDLLLRAVVSEFALSARGSPPSSLQALASWAFQPGQATRPA